MRVGFTGTREGMTLKQHWRVSDWFHYPRDGSAPRVPTEFHHGCSVGADADLVTTIMRGRIGATDDRTWADIHAHPCTLDGMVDRGAEALSSEVHPAKPPLERNRDIVDSCDVLLACPKTMDEEQRSGTWATIRYARKVGRPVVIFWPDGKVTE